MNVLDDPNGRPLRTIVKFEESPSKTLYISIRGTKGDDVKFFCEHLLSLNQEAVHSSDGINNWVSNLSANVVPLHSTLGGNESPAARVHSGFHYCALKCWPLVESCVGKFLIRHKGSPIKVYLVGHSLGAAIATLLCFPLKKLLAEIDTTLVVSLVTFGSPRVGNSAFKTVIDAALIGGECIRVVNDFDVVTYAPFSIPGSEIDYEHVSKPYNVQPKFSRHIAAARYLVHTMTGKGGSGVITKELINAALTHHDLKMYRSFMTMGLAGVIAYNGIHMMQIVRQFLVDKPIINHIPNRVPLSEKFSISTGIMALSALTPAGAIIVGLEVANLGIGVYNTIQLQKLCKEQQKLSAQIVAVRSDVEKVSRQIDELLAHQRETRSAIESLHSELFAINVHILNVDKANVIGWQNSLFDLILVRDFARIPDWYGNVSHVMNQHYSQLCLGAHSNMDSFDLARFHEAAQRIFLLFSLVEIRKKCLSIKIEQHAEDQDLTVVESAKTLLMTSLDSWYIDIGMVLGRFVSLSKEYDQGVVKQLSNQFAEVFFSKKYDNGSMNISTLRDLEIVHAMTNVEDLSSMKCRDSAYRSLALCPHETPYSRFIIDVLLVGDKSTRNVYRTCVEVLSDNSVVGESSTNLTKRLDYFVLRELSKINSRSPDHVEVVINLIERLKLKSGFEVLCQLSRSLSCKECFLSSIYEEEIVQYLAVAVRTLHEWNVDESVKERLIVLLHSVVGLFCVVIPDSHGVSIAALTFLPVFQKCRGDCAIWLMKQYAFALEVAVPTMMKLSFLTSKGGIVRLWQQAFAIFCTLRDVNCFAEEGCPVFKLIARLLKLFDQYFDKSGDVDERMFREAVVYLNTVASMVESGHISFAIIEFWLKSILKLVSLRRLDSVERKLLCCCIEENLSELQKYDTASVLNGRHEINELRQFCRS